MIRVWICIEVLKKSIFQKISIVTLKCHKLTEKYQSEQKLMLKISCIKVFVDVL